jgi:hypothetical protein
MMSTITINTPCLLSLSGEKKKTYKGNFEEILQESVEEILSSLGSSCKQAMYLQLERAFNIKKQEVSHKTKEFAIALEKIFGYSAKFIELRIIEKLNEKIPNFIYYTRKKDLVFTEYIASLRRFCSA